MTAGWFAPRLLALHVLAIAVLAVCVLMGLWQLGVYGAKHDDRIAEQRRAQPVELLSVWGPDDAFREDLVNRRVIVNGRIDIRDLYRVKRPDGTTWVVAPVSIDRTDAQLLVVLGLDQTLTDFNPQRRFTAVLQPAEATGGLSVAQRINVSSKDLFSGYAVAEGGMDGYDPVDLPDRHIAWTVGLRNLAYALQWWVFGLFAVFMWWRMASDAVAIEESVAESR